MVGENCFCQASLRKRTLWYVRKRCKGKGKGNLQSRPVLKGNDYGSLAAQPPNFKKNLVK